MPARNRLSVPLAFEQFLSPHHLGIIAVPNLKQVGRSDSYGACFCLATMPSRSSSQHLSKRAIPDPSM